MQSPCAAACRAVLATHTEGDPGAHGDGDTEVNANNGSRHGVMAEAGKQGMARQGNADQQMQHKQAGM